MQTTLLGLAIAFIVALIAALVGPFFIDWNQYKPQFEAEASRIIGAPVRVSGALDARLLPAPVLRLRSLSVGAKADASRMSADKLDVEFSLGSLLRGEWRASELSLDGVALDIGLDRQGRIDWPSAKSGFNFGALTVDRLNLTGRISLHDAGSGAHVDLDDLTFKGDVRGLTASLRGEGAVRIAGALTPFRLSTGQAADGKGTRLRLMLDQAERNPGADLDGVLTLDARRPGFDGAVTLAGTAGHPWKLNAKGKADPAGAAFDQVELTYGADDVGLKLAGRIDAPFGAAPRMQVKLSASQLDADRLETRSDTPETAPRLIPKLRALVAAVPSAPLPTQIAIDVEQIVLGGRPLRNLAVRLHSDARNWTVDGIELQAPGNTRVTARGAVAISERSSTFSGPLDVRSGDVMILAEWLAGRAAPVSHRELPFQLAGALMVAADLVAVDAKQARLGGNSIQGRVAMAGSVLQADLTSPAFNADEVHDLARLLTRQQGLLPPEAQLSLNITDATLGGENLGPVNLQFAYSPQAISLDRLEIGGAGELAVSGYGLFDRVGALGSLSLNATAPSFDRFKRFIPHDAPAIVERLRALSVPPGDAHASLSVEMGKSQQRAGQVDARATLAINAPQIKVEASVATASAFHAETGLDLGALPKSPVTLKTKIEMEQGSGLLGWLALDRMIASPGSLRLEGSASGMWRSPLQFDVKLVGDDIDADVQGTGDPWADPPAATATLKARRLDIAPLFDLKSAVVAGLSSRLATTDNALTFDDLDATVGATRARGRLKISREPATIDGALTMNALDLGAVAGVVLGASGRGADEPLGPGWLQGWRGTLALEAARAALPGGAEIKDLAGVLRADGSSLSVDPFKGRIGEGAVNAQITSRREAANTSLNAQLQLTDADGAALKYRNLTVPDGKVSLRMTLTSEGRSAAALSNALSGGGVLTLEHAQIDGLDPAAFDAAVQASDAGLAADDARLAAIAGPALMKRGFPISSAQVSFGIRDGRLRIDPTTVQTDRARVVLSGGYDIPADQVDLRASLASLTLGTAAVRPEIQLFLHGTPDGLNKQVDVAALSSWLALRAVDRETRRLDQLEGRKDATPALVTPNEPPAGEPSPQSEAPQPGAPLAPAQVRLPPRDPRKHVAPKPDVSKPAAPKPAVLPRTPNVEATGQHVAPLPPPINIRPLPGDLHSQRPRQPAPGAAF
ncbi:MAG: AsmA family protein [Rhizobiales bacterium]|nr:AsmA family protein [Hyphomicrobiales bacterium]